jgi:hypothetical protein
MVGIVNKIIGVRSDIWLLLERWLPVLTVEDDSVVKYSVSIISWTIPIYRTYGLDGGCAVDVERDNSAVACSGVAVF